MKKRKKNKYKKILIGAASTVSIFMLLFYFINDNRSNNFLFSTIKDLSANISKVTSFSFNDKTKLNDNLSYEINKDYENEIKNLKETLSLNSLNSTKKFINSTVIKRSTDYWYDIITIDKGKKDGVKNGLAVINNNGLIGKVIKTNNYTSDIKLIITSKEENYISAIFTYENNNYYGLIDSYDLLNNELILKNVIGQFDSEKIKGISVTTSGLSDSFTSGLLIGKIKSIEKDTFKISYNIVIEPSVDFNNLNIVSVIVGDK